MLSAGRRSALHPTSYTLHPAHDTTHYTLHTRTLHTTHYTLHTLHPTPYTLNPHPDAGGEGSGVGVQGLPRACCLLGDGARPLDPPGVSVPGVVFRVMA